MASEPTVFERILRLAQAERNRRKTTFPVSDRLMQAALAWRESHPTIPKVFEEIDPIIKLKA